MSGYRTGLLVEENIDMTLKSLGNDYRKWDDKVTTTVARDNKRSADSNSNGDLFRSSIHNFMRSTKQTLLFLLVVETETGKLYQC